MKLLYQSILVILCAIFLVSCSDNSENNTNGNTIEDLLTNVSDGTYTGVGEGFKGEIVIDVIVENGEITAINIVEHEETKDIAEPAFEEIPNKIIESQSSFVDTYSGATYASKGIIEAVENALATANN